MKASEFKQVFNGKHVHAHGVIQVDRFVGYFKCGLCGRMQEDH